MTFEVHYWKAEPFFRKHEKFIRESWERYYSLEFDMLNTSQEQFKLLKEAKQCFAEEKNIDSEAKSALMKWFNRNINHAQEYVIANGSASASQSSQSDETLIASESTQEGQNTGKPVEKINWMGTQTQLAYLVRLLIEKRFLEHGEHWKMIADHYTVKGKQIGNQQIATAIGNVENYNKEGKPIKAETLESIVKEISSLKD